MEWKGNANEDFRKQKLLEKERQMEKQNKIPNACGRRAARTTVVKRKNALLPRINACLLNCLLDLLEFCFRS